MIQSIPSPKAEPFKLWLAQVGSERLEEISNLEKAILRGVGYYKNKGYEDSWITQRVTSIGIRKELTDEWKNRGISEEKDYAILTNEMLKAWSGMTVKEYKKVKGLKDESLRDNMSNLEIVLNMLAEVTTTEISKSGGKVARSAKIEYEKEVEVKDMKENLKYERLDKKDISEEQFKQIMDVENSTGSGYSEDVMRRMWLEDEKNSNFVCKCNNKIVAIISFNPLSKRRNGSIYMVNLTVHPEYRKAGIAQNLIYTACKYYEKENNNLPMSLQVDKDNIPAINLYKKVGFKIEEPICEADEDDEQYIMEADIEELVKNIQKIQNIKR